MVAFDPYLTWLGIPPHEQPPSFYRLLGVVLFESNPDVIQQAADRQWLQVSAFQSGPQGQLCQRVLSEIAMARFCLLDPQQKAAYDGQLYQSVSQRGEQAVAAAPPSAALGAMRQSGYPEPPGIPTPPPPCLPADQRRASLPGVSILANMMPRAGEVMSPAAPPPCLPADQRRASLPGESMPPTLLPRPGEGMPPYGLPRPVQAMPQPSPPTAIPVARPFPAMAARAAAAAGAAQATAPPAIPPAAPQRPIDELESLTRQPASRRRLLKRKKKADYTMAIVVAVVAAAGALMLLVRAAVTHQDESPSGWNAIERENPAEPPPKDKTKKPAAKQASAHAAAKGPLHKVAKVNGQPKNTGDVDATLPTPNDFGGPAQAMDATASGGPVATTPQPGGHDTPQDLGGDNDPVMEKPKP